MGDAEISDGVSRRAVLAGAAGLTGVLAAAGATWSSPASAAPAGGAGPDVQASTPTSIIDLTLDGDTRSTPLRSVEGGAVAAEVINDAGNKHVGNIKFEEITVQFGSNASPGVRSWLREAVAGNAPRRSGAIRMLDGMLAGMTLKFLDAVITEFDLPPLDATSKDPTYMSIKLAPESSGLKLGGDAPTGKVAAFGSSGFKVEIDGIDGSKVEKIETIAFTQPVPVGLASSLAPDVSSLKMTVPAAGADDFFSWFEDFVINGNNDKERTGVLSLLNSTGVPLLTVGLNGVGIYSLRPAAMSRSTTIEKIEVAAYVESLYPVKW